ncbi:hypothetical protein ATPR_2784 [Acetobacter tropicalis NBRC 101654]|uniref:Uncharacterized protein n=1 Tax=Acetobacter tropicalis NBRC 101654 TaxID=749388 RepID=F7VHD5_9PROT|nr:hypothetical protein ATPR_2784 [Acetobacter tropicalis NBRC 101654]
MLICLRLPFKILKHAEPHAEHGPMKRSIPPPSVVFCRVQSSPLRRSGVPGCDVLKWARQPCVMSGL